MRNGMNARKASRWLSVGLLLAAMPAAATPIVTGNFGGGLPILDGAAGTSFSIDGDGTFDLNFAWFGVSVNSIFGWDGVVRPLGSTAIIGATDSNGRFVPTRFAAGANIGPGVGSATTANAFAAYEENFMTFVQGGSFLDGQPGFVGFSFDVGGATHWGWAEIQVDTTQDPGMGALLLLRYGWESAADTALAAGVPEPGTALLLFAGSAALVRIRQRSAR